MQHRRSEARRPESAAFRWHPCIDGLLTDTADSNHHMRALNDTLGYRPTHKIVTLQLDL
ncbi:hypothetical protein [Streptosporangium sp. NPDC000396]|uniref:hypothetical protein n=1 Tax=Streptosporangium sp. NPDC000396 TaxID=3366185 RepID=UPI0036A22AC7